MDVRSSLAGPSSLGPTITVYFVDLTVLYFFKIKGQQNKNFVDLKGGEYGLSN